MRRAQRIRGFTIIEMVVTIAIFALLTAMGAPTLSKWMNNVKVRSVADALQNGLRVAQAESLRRSRQVVFSLTNSTSPQTSLTAVANGSYWSINTIPALVGETSAFVQSGVLSSTSSGVTITGPAAICFSSVGRLVANGGTGIAGATCALPAGNPAVTTFNIAVAGSDRPLNVQVGLGGRVHMCDPAFTLSSANPDGC